MTYHAGKRRDGQPVELGDLMLADKINHAVERAQSLVLPRVAADLEAKERIRSALIAAICSPAGCYGVIYVDNAMVPRSLHARRSRLPHDHRHTHGRRAEQVPDVVTDR